jgi:hypothetical protein
VKKRRDSGFGKKETAADSRHKEEQKKSPYVPN